MITVAIPTHDMADKEILFGRCLESLWMQTFQDFEVVVTDNSEDNVIYDICKWYNTGIHYYRNPRKGMAQNTNEAIKQSKGELIKILYMDDYLVHTHALERMVNKFDGQWLVTGCNHTITGEEHFNNHIPKYSHDIHTGNNTIGSPSVLVIKNENPLLFDEEMTWLLDCDYYKRMYEKYGEPVILKDILVCIGLHPGQATHLMGDARKLQEQEYITRKHNA
jgi:glycosyltransferase involved in cell wall biosynthesis